MNSVQKSGVESKFERLHQLALTMYRNGDAGAALKIWRRILEKNPEFPDINKWISRAAQVPDPAIEKARRTDPIVYRKQRQMMTHYGQSARNRQFYPKVSASGMTPRFRHRNVVYLLLIAALMCIFLSVRNNRSYMVVLNPVTSNLDCYQGLFFPFGSQLTSELEVGIDKDWTDVFSDHEILSRLKKGITVHSVEAFDTLMIDLYMSLGDEALKQLKIRSQQSAIYYYKQIESANFKELVQSKIALAFLNLAELRVNEGNIGEATFLLQSARSYDHSHPKIFTIQELLKQNSEASSASYR